MAILSLQSISLERFFLIEKLYSTNYFGTEWAPQNVDDISIGSSFLAFSRTWSILTSFWTSKPYPDLHSAVVVPKTQYMAIFNSYDKHLSNMENSYISICFRRLHYRIIYLRKYRFQLNAHLFWLKIVLVPRILVIHKFFQRACLPCLWHQHKKLCKTQ